MSNGRLPRLRLGVDADAADLARVQCASARLGYRGIFPPDAPQPTPSTLEPSWTRLLRDAEATVVVAEVMDEVVGVAVVREEREVRSGWLLCRLYVVPSSWGRTVGGRLHDAAVALVRDRGARSLNLWVLEQNHRARAMYERRGWVLVPGPHLEPAAGVVEVLYELALSDDEPS